jgi:predicted dehydrogenase
MLQREHLDGVVVTVTHNAHHELTKVCLNAGLQMMLENPMTLKTKDAHKLIDLAAQRGRELIIGYPWHFIETTCRARAVMQSGRLGRVQYVLCLFAAPVIEFCRANDVAYPPMFQYPVTGPDGIYADPKVSGGGQGYLQERCSGRWLPKRPTHASPPARIR